MYDDFAFDFRNPVANIIDISDKEKFAIERAGNEREPRKEHVQGRSVNLHPRIIVHVADLKEEDAYRSGDPNQRFS